MLKKLCSRCNKVIGYTEVCECSIRAKKNNDKQYNKECRNKEADAIYQSKQWRIVRRVIKNRCKGLCIMCLNSKSIQPLYLIHHIATLEDDKSRAYDNTNLIGLCSTCHAIVHSEYDKGKRDKEVMQGKLYKMLKDYEEEYME